MGYRSEVCIALDASAADSLNAYMEVLPNNKHIKELLNDADGTIESEGVLKYYWDHIKWYEGYPGIDVLDTLLCNLPDEAYGFVRIGEDSQDIEERGLPYEFDIHVTRSITW